MINLKNEKIHVVQWLSLLLQFYIPDEKARLVSYFLHEACRYIVYCLYRTLVVTQAWECITNKHSNITLWWVYLEENDIN